MRAVQIYKSYQQGTGELPILKGLDLEIKEGEAVSIMGASGAGKSTLMHVLGTLDRPNRGQLWFQDKNLLEMGDDEISLFRNEKMGFVFQFHHLLSELTAFENIILPGRIAGLEISEVRKRAYELLHLMGIRERADHYPNELSGGELQRVAIARALVRRPKVLFADEPTGNLDSTNSIIVQNLFFTLKEEYGLTLVVVTHDLTFGQKFPRLLLMKDGRFSNQD
ncbi:MAG: ABC transporter ATP-binding protein [Bdellovibrionaceae bacterium]|nr:ABC transporter ATP-binding protein [Pseudobdellovibrionaceae bacterium]